MSIYQFHNFLNKSIDNIMEILLNEIVKKYCVGKKLYEIDKKDTIILKVKNHKKIL